MVNNSTNINKTKERLNSDGQQFRQYQQNKRKLSLFKLSFALFILEELLTITV
jgi:hypothetical protein